MSLVIEGGVLPRPSWALLRHMINNLFKVSIKVIALPTRYAFKYCENYLEEK